MNLPMQLAHPLVKDPSILSPRHSVHARRRMVLESVVALRQKRRRDMEQQCREPQPPIPASRFAYTFKTPRRTTGPALCPGCGDLVGVPFGYAPSLHHLLRVNPFVRRLLRCRVGGGALAR